MQRAAVFFDRDNTLIANDGYLGDPEQVVLIHGAAEAVARTRELGFATVVFSNQSGVARGLFDVDAVEAVNNRLDELLADENAAAIIERHEFCPFHPDGTVDSYKKESPLRKPAPGMLLRAAEALSLDLAKSWVIGDAPRDIEAGNAAGCRTILFQDHALSASPAASATAEVLPDYSVQSLTEAMDIIARFTASEQPPTIAPVAPLREEAGQTVRVIETSKMEAEPCRFVPPPAVEIHATDLSRLEATTALILQQLQQPQMTTQPEVAAAKQSIQASADAHFSISKMIAGIVQTLALATTALAYRADNPHNTLLLAIMLQLFTIALLIMGRQR